MDGKQIEPVAWLGEGTYGCVELIKVSVPSSRATSLDIRRPPASARASHDVPHFGHALATNDGSTAWPQSSVQQTEELATGGFTPAPLSGTGMHAATPAVTSAVSALAGAPGQPGEALDGQGEMEQLVLAAKKLECHEEGGSCAAEHMRLSRMQVGAWLGAG